jgi:uncharacterized protein (DUF1800 family)
MATKAELDRLEISRLFNRFGFGPRPGEFTQALSSGVRVTQEKLIVQPPREVVENQYDDVRPRDLGPRPAQGGFALVEFSNEMRAQNIALPLWQLDQMVLSDYPLHEKMVWFWHGHWATSLSKLNYALPMFKQNLTFRKYALGNFAELSEAMLTDGALQYWLDGQENTAKAPNENLARELMELFVLGVNKYSEDDVKALARILTGYQVVRYNGNVTFNPRRHDGAPVTLLGTTQVFTSEGAVRYLTERSDAQTFITDRIWFRLISSSEGAPTSLDRSTFNSRDTFSFLNSLARSSVMRDEKYAMVKSPVEWFVGSCRALALTPSQTKKPTALMKQLEKLAQLPFYPPNVGGWPAGELWLTSASSQFRLALAAQLVSEADLTPLISTAAKSRARYLADLLGVYQWSDRTESALIAARTEPMRMLQLALCAPEFVVGA